MTMPLTARPANGHAKPADVLRLGDTTEERRPVEINGRTLMAWVTQNGRYPSSVAAELDDARNHWLAERRPVDPSVTTPAALWLAAVQLADLSDDESSSPDAIVSAAKEIAQIVRELQEEPEARSSEVVWQDYLTQALCILIPGLETHEADMLPTVQRLTALYELGYMRRREEVEASNEGEAEPGGTPQRPPEAGPTSIGAEPEPASAASME
jgi:hypothetical protein